MSDEMPLCIFSLLCLAILKKKCAQGGYLEDLSPLRAANN